ncbi:hypothetical protein EHM76_06105 [bacterium]|nr:MAG: hypothetical protein EHM76_06105 [bacterium]
MASSRRQKGIRTSLLGKLGGLMHIPQQTVRDAYLNLISILAEKEPLAFATELDLDADQLAFLIHDRVKAAAIVKQITAGKREADKKEKIKVPKKPAPAQKKEEVPVKEPVEAKAETMETVTPAEPEPAVPGQPDKQSKGSGRQATLF